MNETKSPAFQFYANDFLGSGKVADMSLQEIGAYTLLLCYDWNETGLPNDMGKLAKRARMSPRRFAVAWANLRENFALREGRWYNPRLEKERAKQQEWREKSARGGHASAEVRWGDGGKGGVTVVTECLTPNCNTPSSTPLTTNNNNLPAPSGARVKKPSAMKYPHFPTDICARLWKVWCDKRGVVTIGTFRMHMAELYKADGPAYDEQQLTDAIVCFAEFASEIPPNYAHKQTVKVFVEGIHGWVRLGGMKNTGEDGMLTERFRVMEKAGAWKVA